MDWRTVTFDWNHARAFLVTAREGSFSAAGRALGIAQPTVGRQVAALEEELGVTLFERVGRGLALTGAGMELLEHVGAMGEAATRTALAAAGSATALEGVVIVTASEVITAHLLPPLVARVRAAHPGIELELVATNETRDLRRREADIAVRSFRPRDEELVAQRIHEGAARFYATPAYAARLGGLRTPDDATHAEFFGFDRSDRMIQGLEPLGLRLTQRNFPLITSNHLVQWEMAKHGLGICMMMEEIGDAEPRVCRVLDSLPPLPVPMWLTTHREVHTSRRIRVVYDLLAEGLRGMVGRPLAGWAEELG
ncbi:MAG: LysR family transcriptional regulator [Alphaproteobacteria bacterium]|nr:LysR family transcriptional regulator [Alphaproteobacteria bacterium]